MIDNDINVEDLNLPPGTERRLRRIGQFPPVYKVGRRRFIRRAAWDEWVTEQEARQSNKSAAAGGDP